MQAQRRPIPEIQSHRIDRNGMEDIEQSLIKGEPMTYCGIDDF